MSRSRLLAVLFAATGALASAPSLDAQTITVDAALNSAYVWRGLSLSNKPVLQPDVILSVPVGAAGGFTFGVWGNTELGRYDDPSDDLSQGGGLSGLDLTEVDAWGEYTHTFGLLTATVGGLGYFFPNDAGFTDDFNTVEIYARAQLSSAPLAPRLGVWYDVDKVNGAYIEGAVSHGLAVTPSVPLTLGAVAGFNVGQSPDPDDFAYNFAGDGFVFLDLSAASAIPVGAVTVTPQVHFLVNGDDGAKITRPGNLEDVKAWFGVALSWSRKLAGE